MTPGDPEHWEAVYSSKKPDDVSWFQAIPHLSLEMISGLGLGAESRAIDVGGGASTLAGHLLGMGIGSVMVIDFSETALDRARQALGEKASEVQWMTGDITTAGLPAEGIDLWHDRAVFHFLIEEGSRSAYLRQLMAALAPGGYALVATFAEDGPERCSGLPVMRYDHASLSAVMLEAGLSLIDHRHETHITPSGTHQSFLYCLMRK